MSLTIVPKGFLFSTVEASIKTSGRKDLALIYSQVESNIAGTFTTNNIKAAPVKVNIEKIRSGRGQAIIINSGNANACTGKRGIKDTFDITRLLARHLKIKSSLVYMCSTGVIGVPLPMKRIIPKISELVEQLGQSSIEDVASAIMTTDTFPKIVHKRLKIDRQVGRIVGISKGAGMIFPNMATMLCFIMTDIAINQKTLNKVLHEAVKKSFNRITVDGDRSTNDTALIIANGLLGNKPITEKSSSFKIFKNAIDEITYELSRMIVRDGEGATKVIEIEVKDALSEKDAEKIAFSVANSNLVKTAIYGNDANWGRIMSAIGYSGAKVKEDRIDIYIGNIKIADKGISTGKDNKAKRALKNKNVKIIINLNKGKYSAKVLTCDLSEKYVKLNASYRT